MNRFSVLPFTVAAVVMALPTVARAEPWPAVVYVPTEDITLTPSGTGICAGISMSARIPGRGCIPGAEEETVAAYPDAELLAEGLAAALAPYDVHVTTVPPPEYQPFLIVLASDEPSEKSNSFTCTSQTLSCASRNRDGYAFTSGGTLQCTDPDTLAATLYAFGRLSGLEGKVANPGDPKDPKAPPPIPDPMDFPPDYTTPATRFQDRCDPIAHQIVIDEDTGDQSEAPLECTSQDHVGCEEAEQQNSHADLIDYYGEFREDVDPPAFENIVPEDGAVLERGSTLTLDVEVIDEDPHVALRWTVESPALEDVIPGGVFTACTSALCTVNFLGNVPFKATDSDWAQPLDPPPGEYTITLEAADYHGNVAEPVVITVTIGEASGGSSSTDDGGGEDEDEDDGVFTSADDSSSESGADGGGGNDDDSGCSCSQRGGGRGQGNLLLLFGALGLVGYRGRRSAAFAAKR